MTTTSQAAGASSTPDDGRPALDDPTTRRALSRYATTGVAWVALGLALVVVGALDKRLDWLIVVGLGAIISGGVVLYRSGRMRAMLPAASWHPYACRFGYSTSTVPTGERRIFALFPSDDQPGEPLIGTLGSCIAFRADALARRDSLWGARAGEDLVIVAPGPKNLIWARRPRGERQARRWQRKLGL